MSIHVSLVKLIRKMNTDKPAACAVEVPNMTDEEVMRMMFTNFRGGHKDQLSGLQLSQGGLAIMKKFFKAYPIEFPNQLTFSSRHILYLDRMATMPWHATPMLPVTITFFEPDLAMKAKLVGDLDILMGAFDS